MLDDQALNILVAENVIHVCAHVLGGPLTDDPPAPGFGPERRCTKCDKDGFNLMSDYEGKLSVGNYLRDIITVLQMMGTYGWTWDLSGTTEVYQCRFKRGRLSYSATESSIGRTVCIAAVRAQGVNI